MSQWTLNPVAEPASLGLSAGRLERAAAIVEAWAQEKPGRAATLLVARYGQVALHRGFGQFLPWGQEPGPPRPTQPDTIYLVASLTKPVVATAAMLLVERGELLLDEPVRRLIPEFAAEDRRDVRVWHLLTHTSGLPDQLPENVELRHRHAPLSEFVRRVCATPLLFAPGTDCRYQSMGTLLLGEIIERLTGQPLRQFLHSELFEPLGLRDTWLGLGPLPRERIAWVLAPEAEAESDWRRNSAWWRDLGAPWGGLHTTAGDYATILQLFLDRGRCGHNGLLSPATVAAMTADQLAAAPLLSERTRREQGWGLGWALNRPKGSHSMPELTSARTFGHAGATGAVGWADPETDLLCVLLTNWPESSRLRTAVGNVVAGAVGA